MRDFGYEHMIDETPGYFDDDGLVSPGNSRERSYMADRQSDGWELVTVHWKLGNFYTYYWKRPVTKEKTKINARTNDALIKMSNKIHALELVLGQIYTNGLGDMSHEAGTARQAILKVSKEYGGKLKYYIDSAKKP